MSKKLIPAPLDGKNVTTDWMEEIFDGYNYVPCERDGMILTGFVANRPVTCYISDNMLFWHIDKWMCGVFALNDAYDELIRRLKKLDSPPSPPLVVKYDTSMRDEQILLQQFFFEVD